MEHDPAVLEYYDQPPAIKLRYESATGRSLGVVHTPDFFVLRTDGARWEEWKPEETLLRLSTSSPNRYVRDGTGTWRCPPGEAYARDYNLGYALCSSSSIDWVLQRNLRFLEDYLRAEIAPRAEALEEIAAALGESPELPLADLLARLRIASADDVFAAIAREMLAVDLSAAALAEPSRVRVYRDRELAVATTHARAAGVTAGLDHRLGVRCAAGERIGWDGRVWIVANAGDSAVSLLGENGALVTLSREAFGRLAYDGFVVAAEAFVTMSADEVDRALRTASPEELRDANRRHEIMRAYMDTGTVPPGVGVTRRAVQHWLRRYREAEERTGVGFIGLLPATHLRGNRTRKLPELTLRLTREAIDTLYSTAEGRGVETTHRLLQARCAERGVVAPSLKTFRREVKRARGPEQTRSRKGRRAAYQEETFHWELELTTPRHGDRPFEIVHFDHTELDLELVCSETARPLGRPWMTLVVDAFARRILVALCLFDPPSYRTLMLAVRELVRRYGRVPQSAVVDNGKEFRSVYFDALLARFECVKKLRPPAEPRAGSLCERLFGTANTEFVHNLAGNTKLTRNVREVTASVEPRGLALWTLPGFAERLGRWAYEVYDAAEHPALGCSPREAFEVGIQRSGARAHRLVPYDETFRMATLPAAPRGAAKVDPQRGVKAHYLWYWAEAMRHPEVAGSRVPVRYDPFDVGIGYAYLRGRWEQCVSEHYAVFRGRTERELRLASLELRRRRQLHGERAAVSGRALAELLAESGRYEALERQRRRDADARRVLLTLATPPDLTEPPPPVSPAPQESSREQRAAAPDPARRIAYEEY